MAGKRNLRGISQPEIVVIICLPAAVRVISIKVLERRALLPHQLGAEGQISVTFQGHTVKWQPIERKTTGTVCNRMA